MEKSEDTGPALSRTIKLVIIASSIPKFKPIVNFLMKRGYSTTATSDVKKAMTLVQSERPDFVLISWNLKDAVPVKIAELLTTKLKVHCIGFAEESDTKTAAALASSTLKNIIHAPISGPVLFMRLQKILKQRETLSHEAASLKKTQHFTLESGANIQLVSASNAEIKGHPGSWVQKGTKEGKAVWMFKYDKGNLAGANYYYQGDWPPVMSKDGEWSLSEGALFRQPGVVTKDHEAIQEMSIDKQSTPSWIPSENEKKGRRQIQQDSLKFIIETVINANPDSKIRYPISAENLGVVEVRSDVQNGYILIAQPHDATISEAVLRMFKNNIEQSLRESRSGAWTEYDFIVHKKMIAFQEWMREKGKFILEGTFQKQNINVYFLERTTPKEHANAIVQDGKKLLPIQFFRPEELVDFDVFIKLEKNRRYLKYFKKGTIIHEDRLKNLRKQQVEKLFVSEKEWSFVHQYEAEGFFQSEYKKYQDEHLVKTVV